ncbi:MAG: DNA-binding transcriptional MocR family regulator [Phenylobacterium sp.]|jgi:DNA-binding transcriptional MocR family regulator
MANFKYRQIVEDIVTSIHQGALQHKLYSVREYAKIKGVGISTVTQAYHELEKQGWIRAEAKRGYFVCEQQQSRQPAYGHDYQRIKAGQNLATAVQYTFNDPEILPLSCTAPGSAIDNEVLLNRQHKQVLKQRPYQLRDSDPTEGIKPLRQQICRHMLRSDEVFSHQQVIITNGRQEGLLLALVAAKAIGKTVAVESPVSFYFQTILRQLNNDVIEVPMQADYTLELALLSKAHQAQPFDTYLVNPSFADPTGRLLSLDDKLALIDWAQQHQVTLIEYDRSELVFSGQRPATIAGLANAQQRGNIISIGDFYDTISPAINLGYLICVNTLDTSLYARQTIGEPPSLTLQHMVANLMVSGEYQRIVLKLRAQLLQNYRNSKTLLAAHLNQHKIYISQPAGGPCLWFKLPEGYSSEVLWQKVIDAKLSIAPGTMFSMEQQYDCFFRITFALPWNNKMQKGISRLGEVIAQYISGDG